MSLGIRYCTEGNPVIAKVPKEIPSKIYEINWGRILNKVKENISNTFTRMFK
jgi:hypothetical protein